MNAPPGLLDVSYLIEHSIQLKDIKISPNEVKTDTKPQIRGKYILVAIINNKRAIKISNFIEFDIVIMDCKADNKTIEFLFLPKEPIEKLFSEELIIKEISGNGHAVYEN